MLPRCKDQSKYQRTKRGEKQNNKERNERGSDSNDESKMLWF